MGHYRVTSWKKRKKVLFLAGFSRFSLAEWKERD